MISALTKSRLERQSKFGVEQGWRFLSRSFAFHRFKWRGDYSKDTKEFAFLLRIAASIHKYTEMWQIIGAQPAKLKRGHVEVEIGISEAWWRQSVTSSYRQRLAGEVEKGFNSIIDLLRERGREIKAEQLLKDWAEIKHQYLRHTEASLVQ